MRIAVFVLSVVVAWTHQARAEAPGDVFEGAEVLAEAATPAELIAQARPFAVWNGTDMLWVREGRDGVPRFILNHAQIRQAGASTRYALMRRRADVQYVPGLDGEFSYCEADVVREPAGSDSGPPSHAVVFDRHQKRGTLYRVRWRTEPSMGSGLYSTLRDVFVLRAPDGRWRFIGEGASLVSGRGSRGEWFVEDVTYRLDWSVDESRGVAITATLTHTDGGTASQDAPPAKRDLASHREGTLDPKTHAMCFGRRAWTKANDGETLDSVIERIAEWNLGYQFDSDANGRDELLALFRPLVRKLNPKSAAKPKLDAGERILVPEWDEIRNTLDGSPATRPTKRT